MTLYDRLIKIRDRGAKVAQRLGMSKIRKVWIITRFSDRSWEKVEVNPDPFVDETRLDFESIANNINLKGIGRTLLVKGISKAYDRTVLEADNVEYEVESFDQNAKNFHCRLLEIKDMGITWQLTIYEPIAEEQIYEQLYDFTSP